VRAVIITLCSASVRPERKSWRTWGATSAVITLTPHSDPDMRDGMTVVDACRAAEAGGADVVGLNCARGPETMLPLLAEVRDAVSVPVAALPVPYRTSEAEPSFQSLTDDGCGCELPGGRPFPTALDPLLTNRYEIAEFAREAHALGVSYLGVCCGNAPHLTRSMAEALGRTPPASRFSPDMTKHAFLGTDAKLKNHNLAYAKEL